MGFDCELAHHSVVRYSASLDHGLVENEVDHVLLGAWDGAPRPDPREAEGWRWISPRALRARVAEAPEEFTVWFRLILSALDARRGRPRPARRRPAPARD
jgi:isopentenyl-diphosphate delta-isomerase